MMFVNRGVNILFYIIIGVLLIINTLRYLMEPSSYDIPTLFIYLVALITGLFLFRAFYNKTFYSLVTIGVLVVMWIIILVLPNSSDINNTIYYAETGSITLVIVLVLILMLKLWDKMEKEIEVYDKVMNTNPNDSTNIE